MVENAKRKLEREENKRGKGRERERERNFFALLSPASLYLTTSDFLSLSLFSTIVLCAFSTGRERKG